MIDSLDIFFELGFPGLALIIPAFTVEDCFNRYYENEITPIIIIMYFCFILWNYIWLACMKDRERVNKKAIYLMVRVSSVMYIILLLVMCGFMFGQVGWWVLLQLVNMPLYILGIASLLPKR